MTNAIEQAKREMYTWLSWMKDGLKDCSETGAKNTGAAFEDSLEAYLELLRQDHEALHETARKRFEDLQKAEAANQELEASQKKYRTQVADLDNRLGKMTEERDAYRNLHQASEFARDVQGGRAGTSGQVSGERVSCATTDAKTMAVLSAVLDCQQILTDWAVYGARAKKQMKKLAAKLNNNPKLATAMVEFEKMTGSHGAWFVSSETCMHSFFAIGDDQMKCTFCGVWK